VEYLRKATTPPSTAYAMIDETKYWLFCDRAHIAFGSLVSVKTPLEEFPDMVLDSGCQIKFSGVLNFFPGVSQPAERTESHRIHLLSQAQIGGFNLLTTRFFARDQVLLIRPIGLTMFDIFDMGVENRIAAIVRGALSQLSLLHNAGYIHGDIRPLNILLVGDHDTYLADFETCKKVGDYTGFYVDIDGFTPEEIVESPDGAVAFKESFDFECLAYSVAYSVAKTLPWRHADSLAGMLKQRAKFMKSCESANGWLGVAYGIWKMAEGAQTLKQVLDRIPD
jgi:hypothetical protein